MAAVAPAVQRLPCLRHGDDRLDDNRAGPSDVHVRCWLGGARAIADIVLGVHWALMVRGRGRLALIHAHMVSMYASIPCWAQILAIRSASVSVHVSRANRCD